MIGCGERLAEIDAVPSIGTIGDSFCNALAETAHGYYKAELIYGPARTGPWKTVENVELATLGRVHWHNTARLHGYLDDLPPAEFEAKFYGAQRSDQPLAEIQQRPSLRGNQGDSHDLVDSAAGAVPRFVSLAARGTGRPDFTEADSPCLLRSGWLRQRWFAEQGCCCPGHENDGSE